MDHKTCVNLIDDYIFNSLDDSTVDEFIKHVENCPNCYDELVVNYSLRSALSQVERDEELSKDYEAELIEKMSKFKLRKSNNRKLAIGFVVAMFIVSFVVTLVVSAFTTKEKIEYSQDKTATAIEFEVDSLPRDIDPVEVSIDKYNKDIIKYLHSINTSKNEGKK